jgi:hypothetical protein
MIFLPVAPLSKLLSHTRHSLLFHRYNPTHVLHESHRLLLFRLSSSLDKPEFCSISPVPRSKSRPPAHC